MIIIMDSDGLIGSLNPGDIHHQISQRILSRLTKINARLIYPATVIAESVTFLQGRLNNPDLANKILQLVSKNQLIIESVDMSILQEASSLMDLKKSKHNTLFDAIVAVVSKRHQADAIFSFDKFYKNKGFKLASEL